MKGAGNARTLRLFDAHCHLQDRRVSAAAPQIISTALDSGVFRFAVNGTTERDWHLVKEMGEEYSCVVPNFGLHPWFVMERSPNWLNLLRDLFATTPSAAVGEIGLDKGSKGKTIDFSVQVEVFCQQLELAKELERPVSIHCVRAFGDLLEILQHAGPFPAGVILHSYIGSAEMVTPLAKLGTYFSFSGHLTSLKPAKAKKMLKLVPIDRILLESDAPDAVPTWENCSLVPVPVDESTSPELPKDELNHPANVHTVLNYVAGLLEMPEDELAETSYQNATRLFSYPGSKVSCEG